MDGTRVYRAKGNKSLRERQIPYDFTHMWNLRNKTDERVGGKEREANHKKQTLNYREQTGLLEGGWVGGWAKWGMGIEEDICWDEPRGEHVSDETLNSTPETNIILYVN